MQSGSKFGAVPYYRFKCEDNFILVGNAEVRCGISNTWMDSFPTCVPKVTCPISEDYTLGDDVSITSFFVDLYEYNNTDVGIPGSMYIASCDKSDNQSMVMIGDSVRMCTETGKWSGIQPYCIGEQLHY